MTIRPLSDALRKKAEEELHETPARITDGIKTLRHWIQQHPHLISISITDQWLVAFLRGCKYNMEKAKSKIEVYYTLKTTIPEFYANRDPFNPEIQELLKLGILLPVKKCMQDDSPRILLSRVGISGKSLTDVIKVSLMVVEILLLEDDNFTVAGEDALVDAEGLSLSLLWQWTPTMAKKLFTCTDKAISIRIKSMHLLKPPLLMGAAIRLFKMFLSAKLRNRIHWHSKDLESLYGHIDKSVLPVEYGGTDGSVVELTEYWKAKVESYRPWFVDENSRSDESNLHSNNNTETQKIQSLEID